MITGLFSVMSKPFAVMLVDIHAVTYIRHSCKLILTDNHSFCTVFYYHTILFSSFIKLQEDHDSRCQSLIAIVILV